jgi:peptide/nickel transport system permease protein
MRIIGLTIIAVVAAAAVFAPVLAPNEPDRRFVNHLNAPPTRPRLLHSAPQSPIANRQSPTNQESLIRNRQLRGPFIYPWGLVNRLEQRYELDRGSPVPLVWFSAGKLVQSSDREAAPLLLAGADRDGRDIFARLLFGARISLLLALVATIGALMIGTVVGAVAGIASPVVDDLLMRLTELVIVLPTIYVVLVLRAALPLVLPPSLVFALMAAVFALVGWPFIARGVRGIVFSEKRRDYAIAARSLGAGRTRLLARHLLPACRGFVSVQATMLVPAFIVAEATMSYVGLGFPDPVASWGTMLRDASDVVTLSEFPWTLAPAVAIFVVVLGFNLAVQGEGFGIRGSGFGTRILPFLGNAGVVGRSDTVSGKGLK